MFYTLLELHYGGTFCCKYLAVDMNNEKRIAYLVYHTICVVWSMIDYPLNSIGWNYSIIYRTDDMRLKKGANTRFLFVYLNVLVSYAKINFLIGMSLDKTDMINDVLKFFLKSFLLLRVFIFWLRMSWKFGVGIISQWLASYFKHHERRNCFSQWLAFCRWES